jgi:hypothetical protein
MTGSCTVGISIRCQPAEVYAYLAEPRNLPAWSAFITAIRQTGDAWTATTPDGEVRIRFSPRNDFGILDHWVSPGPELTVYVPMRVLPIASDGSEVIFTVLRLPGMTDEQFGRDVNLVRSDLITLRRVIEERSGRPGVPAAAPPPDLQ